MMKPQVTLISMVMAFVLNREIPKIISLASTEPPATNDPPTTTEPQFTTERTVIEFPDIKIDDPNEITDTISMRKNCFYVKCLYLKINRVCFERNIE